MEILTREQVIKLTHYRPTLIDIAIEMIELGIKGGYYGDNVADDYDFIIDYLTDEINNGFIKVEHF